ncbi:PepSY domain-containing protein [Halosquirtibacter laminarini]|uniref:PepSY domain-containing protein n=1 Tax=Halosquirtibacter laminarini TaxID=3374600 RepID=A0AC61NP01_9BACT|nr:PepSY domain-containing protein [Prolixibacteraceae bacterium]
MKKLLLKYHRIFGIITLPILLVWFISGYFMLLGGFPRASKSWIESHQKTIPFKVIPKEGISPNSHIHYGAFGWRQIRNFNHNNADTIYLQKNEGSIQSQCEAFGNMLMDEKAEHTTIMHDLDMWIPWSRMRKHLPIYRMKYKDGSNLYISSKTGDVLQRTTTKSKWIACFGAIPHWLYFRTLRENTQIWILVIKFLAILSLIAILTGYIYGGIILVKKRLRNPYKKRHYRWHYLLGISGGLIIFTWTLSGFFSLHHVSNRWIKKGVFNDAQEIWQPTEPINTIALDRLTKLPPNTVDIQSYTIKNRAVVQFTTQKGKHHYYCGDTMDQKVWSQSQLKACFEQTFPNYLVNTVPLEKNIVEISLDDPGESQFQFDLLSGKMIRYTDQEKRVNQFLYQGLHSFMIGSLKTKNTGRILIILFFLTLGTATLLTGLWITIKKR